MNYLEQLATGDPDTWNEAFRCFYPVAFEAARTRLGENLSHECEDVAIETLSEILEKGAQVSTEAELKPLVAAIARNKATDRLRHHFAEKRGGNKVQSLEAMLEENLSELPELPNDELLDHLAAQELRELLTDLASEVKKEYRVVLRDHFFDQLSYNEIAAKRKISVGSVGVYLQRGLASLRSVIARKPKLQGEFLAVLSDASVVRVLLPLVSAVQLGLWFFAHTVRYRFRFPQIDETQLSDQQRLALAVEELPPAQSLSASKEVFLNGRLKERYPKQFDLRCQRREHARRISVRAERFESIAIWLFRIAFPAVVIFAGYLLIQFIRRLF